MSNCKLIWREGKLFEISPFGTGFVEEESTGRAFGFHTSMIGLAGSKPPNELEGRSVRFTVSEDGRIVDVELAMNRESGKPPGKEGTSPASDGKKSHGGSEVHKF
jgi:hypothetical protein